MGSSMIAAHNPAVQNSKSKEKRSTKYKQYFAMVLVVFIILFIFSMLVSIITSGISSAEALNGENHNNNSPDAGNLGVVNSITYNEEQTEPIETENIEKTETTNTTTESSSEPTQEITENITDGDTKPDGESEPVGKVKDYSEDDLYYLAAAICREAGGESEEIQLLVANVVVNRVNSSIYPNTIYDVLTDYKQYGMMWKYGVSFPDWADQKTIDRCYAIAERILDGERVCPENVLFQAEFKQGSGIFKQFGDDYYFCFYG